MDALSDILNTIKLSSTVYFRYDFSPPWGMNVEKGPFAQFHMQGWHGVNLNPRVR